MMDAIVLELILQRAYPVMSDDLSLLSERIREIEGFYVNLSYHKKPHSVSDLSPGRYNFERAASGKMNIGKWLEKRFEPRFPFLKAQVVTSEGRPACDDELLSYVKGATAQLLGTLNIKVESNKETAPEKHADLQKLEQVLASFSIFSHCKLIDEPCKFLFLKWHDNELELRTKPICLRSYEFRAIETILKVLIERCGYAADFQTNSFVSFSYNLDECFSSRDLNHFIPNKKQTYVQKILNLESS